MGKENKKSRRISVLVDDLRELESHIRELWYFLPVPVCLLNPAFRIVSVTKAFERLSEYPKSEVIRKRLSEFLKNFGEIKKALQKEEMIVGQEAVFKAQTKEVPVKISAKTRKDEQRDVTGYYFAFTDLTELKEKEKKLKEKIEELERFQKLATGRELKMVELKEKIKKLKQEKSS